MPFQSKTEAMSYMLMALNRLKDHDKNNKNISLCVQEIQKSFDNHEQNMEVIIDYLKKYLQPIPLSIQSLIEDMRKSNYQQSAEEKFLNPLARRYESGLFSYLLISPTKAMMDSVGLVSQEILIGIDFLKNNAEVILEENANKKVTAKKLLDDFLISLKEFEDPIGCGGR